jgi:outer membrane biosynthesis protein TonB
MVSSARIFFAGVGTTFVILGLGFGSGLLMANSAMKEPAYQKSRVEQAAPARVVLPTSAEAAQAPTPPGQQVAAVEAAPSPSPEPTHVAPPENKIEKVYTKKGEVEERERRKRHSERKARREAARARQQIESRQRQEPRVLAFDGDEARQPVSFGLFGKN